MLKYHLKKLVFLVFFLNLLHIANAQNVNPTQFDCMQWRCIGPHRGGRTVGACGVPQQANVFYIGVNNGGVWKTTDYGRTWDPIFDAQETGSIGDVAVAPSNPNVIYVGSGEGLQRPDLSVGDGMYKSIDAGKTWKHLGLKDAQQIAGISIDPNNENRVFVAALGHPYGPNTERGVYKSLDGGATWQKALYIDENTGAAQVLIDPSNSNTIYADLWAGRQGPWENGQWNGPESGLFKSSDGGTTWKKLYKGLPTTQQGLGRIGVALAPSNPNRLYATVESADYGGVYRSDNAGESWYLLSNDERYFGRSSDFAELKVDPKNADIVYSANVVAWKSTDGGHTWNAFRGAPGGDDYHRFWINPDNPDIILLAVDQGAIITVNGGKTFSSWYNQPTAQFYHVSTDNDFPYNVYSGQQESGSVCIASRGNDGQITSQNWHPVGAQEYGYVAADPLNSNIIYGGKLSRYDKRTGQTQNISPNMGSNGDFRFIRTAPVLFSPIDPKTLYYAGNVLFNTRNEGNSWQVISPDLTRESYDIPESVGIYSENGMKTMKRRGVIYTVAPSPLDSNRIWCGTDDGLIHFTQNGGKTWLNVTPPEINSWDKISLMDASHFDKNTAYAAVNRIRCDDMRPHIYKTNDAGKTWKEIVNGLPNDPINVVREDTNIKGLLFAGSERCVYVSFDDGEHWQSLRLNMPATSIRDLVIKDDDLVVGTHGRSFWILDNINPLREIDFNTKTKLYKPQDTYRVRWDMWTDTPLPKEEPAGKNPPDGAMIDYYLADNAKEISLDISDENGNLIRHFSNSDTLYKLGAMNIPLDWIRPQQILSAKPGSHRFLWNMHYTPLNIPVSFPIGAIMTNTAPNVSAPWVLPGGFVVKLTVDGQTFSQTFNIKMDPRVKTTFEDLQLQQNISLDCYKMRKEIIEIQHQMRNYLNKIHSILATSQGSEADILRESESKVIAFQNLKSDASLGISPAASLASLNNDLSYIFDILEESDRPATSQVIEAFNQSKKQFDYFNVKWKVLQNEFKNTK